jgi:GTP-binding protein HflX
LTLLIPYDRGELISKLHTVGRVITTDYRETGTLVTALVHPQSVEGFKPFEAIHAS